MLDSDRSSPGPRSSDGQPRALRGAWALAAGAVALGLIAAGCGSAPPARPSTGTTAVGSSAPTSTDNPFAGLEPTAAQGRQAAIAGFVAALKAEDAAFRAENTNPPGLAQTEVPPELTRVRDIIIALRLNHDTTHGPPASLGHPVILSYSPTRAIVQTCSPPGGAIAYGANGRPLPGVLGTAPAAVLTGVMVPGTQNWMLQDLAAKVVASCPAP
jgi:hypothetical protein